MKPEHRIIVIKRGIDRAIYFNSQAALNYFRAITPEAPATVAQGPGVATLLGFPVRVATARQWSALAQRVEHL